MPESQPDGDASQNSFAALFSELRRRRVVQVAGLYLLSGSGLIQAADVVLENLGAPAAIARWLTLLVIVGFPVAVTVSWAYDVRVQRERQSQSGDAGRWRPGPAGDRCWHTLRHGAARGGASGGVMGRDATAESIALSNEPVLAVYTVELLDGEHERSFAAALKTLLSDALAHSPGVSTRSRDVLDSYRSQSLPLDSLAARLDIDYLVGARVSATTTATRLTVQVLDARGTVVATSDPFAAGAPSLESAQELARKAADYVLRQVGAELQANRWLYGTRSQEALYALIDAEELIGQAARQPDRGLAARDLLAEADELLRRSMAADPRWSEPALRRAELAVKRAVAARDDGTGAVAALLDEGIAIVDDVLRREPRNADAHAARGMLAYNRALQLQLDSVAHARALAGAERSLQRAYDLDRTLAGAAAQLSDLLYWRADFANARVWAERALARDSYQERAEQLWRLAMATSRSA
jgi:TolB-like protein